MVVVVEVGVEKTKRENSPFHLGSCKRARKIRSSP